MGSPGHRGPALSPSLTRPMLWCCTTLGSRQMMMMPPACQSDTRAGSRWIKTWRFCGIGISCAAARNFSSLKHRCLIWTEVYELRFILGNELELRKKPCFCTHGNFHSWITTTGLLLGWWGCPPAFPAGVCSSHGWKRMDAATLPCSAVRSSAHTQHSVSERCFIPLERGTPGGLTASTCPRAVPEQKTRPSRIWVHVLTAACSWLPSLLGSMSSNSVHLLMQCISSKLHWESRGSGSSGERIRQENCFWTKGFWKCYLGNYLFQWLCKPKSTLRSWVPNIQFKILVPWLALNDPVTWLLFSSVRD